ncbi:hypothetical protein HY345_01440 [Candidatus Microgenomates bacterium]|nr:hypothetical protein [Candidatus Microgenomates bacterium]
MKISKNVVFFLLLFFLLFTPLFASMLPFIIQSLHTPPDRVFMGLHRWSEDYYGYLHLINQGVNGHLMTVNKITNEPHVPTFVHSEYSFLGLIGRLLGLNSVLTYHLSRLILGAVFLTVTFYFFFFLFKLAKSKQPLANSQIAFFLAFFVGGFPHVSLKPFTIEPYLSWWVELDATRRSTILPHYLMGSILMLLVLMLFIKITSRPQRLSKLMLALAGVAFLLAFVHPVDFTLTLGILGFYLFLNLLLAFLNNHFFLQIQISLDKTSFFKKTIPWLITLTLPLFFVLLPGLIPILYFRYVFTLPFYRFITEHGTTTAYNIPLLEFVLALGPALFLALLGIFFSFFHKPYKTHQSDWTNNSLLLVFSWFVVQSFFFFFGYQILNFDRLRSLHGPFFIPLAFFATLLLLKAEKKLKIFGLILNTKYLILLVVFLITLPLSVQSINRQIFEVSDFKSFSTFSYPSQKTYEAFLFLKNNTPEDSFITTAYEARFLLPGVADNKVALGANFENDPAYQKNMEKVILMYQGVLKGSQLQAFLKSQNVSYLYWGYQEKSYGGDLTKENFLQKIFDNGQVTVFAVK